MADEVGLQGRNSADAIHKMENPISPKVCAEALRIAVENGFELVNGKWERIS